MIADPQGLRQSLIPNPQRDEIGQRDGMAGGVERDGWRLQPTNESATVRGPPTMRPQVGSLPTSDPARDPSRADETPMANEMARHERCREAGAHDDVHVCVRREPSSRTECTNEP